MKLQGPLYPLHVYFMGDNLILELDKTGGWQLVADMASLCRITGNEARLAVHVNSLISPKHSFFLADPSTYSSPFLKRYRLSCYLCYLRSMYAQVMQMVSVTLRQTSLPPQLLLSPACQRAASLVLEVIRIYSV